MEKHLQRFSDHYVRIKVNGLTVNQQHRAAEYVVVLHFYHRRRDHTTFIHMFLVFNAANTMNQKADEWIHLFLGCQSYQHSSSPSCAKPSKEFRGPTIYGVMRVQGSSDEIKVLAQHPCIS